MNPFLNLITGDRYLFLATGNRVFIANYVTKYTTSMIVELHSDKYYQRAQGQYSYDQTQILDAFPLSELTPRQRYKFWYLEPKRDENEDCANNEGTIEFYKKSHEGEFIEIIDRSETLCIDTMTNTKHLRMGILSTPLFNIIQIEKL
jgi:hypothetical protein